MTRATMNQIKTEISLKIRIKGISEREKMPLKPSLRNLVKISEDLK